MSLKQLIKVTVVTEAVKVTKVTEVTEVNKVTEVAKVTEVTKVTEVAGADLADDAEATVADRRLTEGHLKAIRKAPEGQ